MVIARHGLFCSLYSDRGSHYFYTPQAGEKVSKLQLTQVGRALKQLGIEHISRPTQPQARGRLGERAFRTLQDRLPKEAGAGRHPQHRGRPTGWLAESYIPAYNAAFAVNPEQDGSAFLPDPAATWAEILCVQEERTVGNDNTVSWNRLCLQLPTSRLRPHFVKATVRVHEYSDGAIARLPRTAPPRRLRRHRQACRHLLPKPRATLPRRPIFPGGMPPGEKKEQERTDHELQIPVNLTS